MQKKLTALAVASALAVGGAAAIAVPALADSSPFPSPSVSGAPAPAPSGTPGTAPGTGQQGTQARTDRIRSELESLVDDGTLTRAQADKVAAKLAASGPMGGMGRGGPGDARGMMGPELMQKAEQVAATAIGISTDQLKTELQKGSTLAEIAKAHGRTEDDVVTPLVAAAKTAIAQAVTDKKLTQDQADRISQNLEQRIRGVVENGHGGTGFRMHGQHGGPGGGPGRPDRGGPGQNSQTPAPEGAPSGSA